MGDPSTEEALRKMSHSIGGLESTIKTLVSTWQSQEANASLGRRDLHQKFEALRGDVDEKFAALASDVRGIAGQVSGAIKDLAEIKPSVDAFENAKTQAIGAQKLGKAIWLALLFLGGGSGAGLTWVLANWVTIGPKPPLH